MTAVARNPVARTWDAVDVAATAVPGTIPVTVLGGYLGAGKTTLLNHLLRNAGATRITVLVNDFGSVNIDADLVEARDGDMLRLAGGCVCCSFGSDLMGALMGLRERVPRPDHVMIETSGVALPGAVASTVRLVPQMRVAARVVAADASMLRRQAADQYVGDLVRGQLQQADLVVLNKTDLIAAEACEALRLWLACEAPQAALRATERGCVPPSLLLSDASRPLASNPLQRWLLPSDEHPAIPGADALFRSRAFEFDLRVDVPALARALATQPFGLVRAKGLLLDRDGTPILLQLTGPQTELSAWPGNVDAQPTLVCIGTAHQWDEAGLAALIQTFTITQPVS